MTSAERAKDIHDRLFRLGKYHFEKVHMDPLKFIASAITSAQNDKLEEAAALVESPYHAATARLNAATAIRSLKSKD